MTKPARPGPDPVGSSRREGRLTGWNGQRGFGFLKPVEGGPDAFAHIRAFAREDRHIEEGELYSYLETSDPKGRLRAADIRLVRAPIDRKTISWMRVLARVPHILVIPAFLFIAGALALSTHVSPLWLVVYGAGSIVTFIGYALDKRAAQQRQWRISETILLLLGLVGGWPGAILAQELFRHKTKKIAFRTLFWISVAVNIAAFVQIAVFTGV